MAISLDIIIPIIVGALVSIIMNSNIITTKILTISAKLANAYYNKKKEKILSKATDDPFELLGLSNETYKIEYVKKPQLIFVLYLVIYNAILITVTILMYLLHYNLLLYILSGFITNVILILVIKIKQKIKARGGNRQQHVT
jgi:hypothetical protein